MRRTALVAACLISTSCSAWHNRTATPISVASPTTSTTSPNRVRCANPTRFGISGTANEIHGESRDAQLWGLALGPGPIPPRTEDELKIVWRMTGRGPLHITFTAPDGRPRPLVFGPEAHSASSYARPGKEWGTEFRFDMRGCWHLHFARTDAAGDVWLEVDPRPEPKG